MPSATKVVAIAAAIIFAATVIPLLAPKPAPAGYDLPPFQYPTNMERFAWSLQSSTDLVTWTTEMSWPSGLVAGGAINIVRDGQHKFYRMQGK